MSSKYRLTEELLPVNPPDEELIAASVSGRNQAFDQLVLRYQDRLFNALLKLLRDREEARDVVQETFVTAWQKLAGFRGEAGFYSWLFRIAYNTAMSRRRKKKLKMTSTDHGPPHQSPEDWHPESRPSHHLELNEQQHSVHVALEHLPEEYRTVLVLKEIENFKYEQIADILDVPLGTIRSRIHRARLLLREQLLRWLPEAAEQARLKSSCHAAKLESPEM